jgi:DNA-binding beta-propeller fold protein YncE
VTLYSPAGFRAPFGLALSPEGDLYVSDEVDSVVRRITNGKVVDVAGISGSSGSTDGQFAQFANPRGLAVTPLDGFVYVADSGNHQIRILYVGGPFVPAFGAGGAAGIPGLVDDVGNGARFNTPSGVAATERGTLYVADTENHAIRQLTPISGIVGVFTISTLAKGALRSPLGVAVDSNNVIYVADTENHAIRKIMNRVVSTLAGEVGVPGNNDGRAAHFNRPSALAVDARGNVFVSDRGNNAIRRIAPSGLVTTVSSGFNAPTGIVVDAAGQIFVADTGNQMIRLIEVASATPSVRRRATRH